MSDESEQEMKNMIQLFKEEFYRRYKITPQVHFSLPEMVPRRIGIEEVLMVADRMFREEIQFNKGLKKFFEKEGIFAKKRSRPKSIYKHVCFVMARELKYTHGEIAEKFKMKTHSSVVSSVKSTKQLLSNGNYQVIKTYITLANAIKKEFGDDGSFQLDLPERIKSKPAILALFNEGEYSDPTHQHTPRTESPGSRRVDKKRRLLQGPNAITGRNSARRSS
jgi:hypothetical protein